MGAAENKKAESEKKYARLPDKALEKLPAAAILLANEKIMDLFARGKKLAMETTRRRLASASFCLALSPSLTSFLSWARSSGGKSDVSASSSCSWARAPAFIRRPSRSWATTPPPRRFPRK